MGFLDSFEGDGEFANETIVDPLYIDTKTPTDLVVKINKLEVKENHSEHRYPGESKLIFEAEVLRAVDGHGSKSGGDARPIREGEDVSNIFPMYENVKASWKKNMFRELVEVLSAASGDNEGTVARSARDYVAQAASGEYNGRFVRVKSKPANDAGYHNLEFMTFDEADLG